MKKTVVGMIAMTAMAAAMGSAFAQEAAKVAPTLTAEEKEQAKDQAALDRQLAQIKSVEALNASTALIGADPIAPAAPVAGVPSVPAAPRATRLDNGGFRHLSEFAQAVRMANPAG